MMFPHIRPKHRLIAAFIAFLVLGFGCFLFYKLKKKGRPLSAPPVSVTFKKKHFETGVILLQETNDLENSKDRSITVEKSSSGLRSCKLSSSNEFGVATTKRLSEIKDYTNLSTITIEFNCWMRDNASGAQYLLSIQDADGKNVAQFSQPIVCSKSYEWNKLSVSFDLNASLIQPDNILKVVPWSKELREFYVDDISVIYKSENAQNTNRVVCPNTFYDFENNVDEFAAQQNYIKPSIAHSGKNAFDLSNADEYGPMVTKQFGDVCVTQAKVVNMSIWVYPLTDNASVELAVSLFDTNNKSYFWQGKTVESNWLPKEKWTKINANVNLPTETVSLDNIIQILARNKSKTKLLFDDFEIVYDDLHEPEGVTSSLDVQALYEHRFAGKHNQPPFPSVYFIKQEIGNQNNTYITAIQNKIPAADFAPNDIFLVGNFVSDANNLDEVICIKKTSQAMFTYANDLKTFHALWTNDKTDSLWNTNANYYAGDFNSDKKTDVLLVDKKNKAWKLIDFDGLKWNVVSSGPAVDSKWMPTKPSDAIISEKDILLPGNYLDTKTTYLKLNTEWRFDLKILAKDESGFTILANVDFKGFSNDFNPKYYECVQLVSGNFISENKTALIVVARNCGDKNYDGKNCTAYENLNYLPNTTQLYQIE